MSNKLLIYTLVETLSIKIIIQDLFIAINVIARSLLAGNLYDLT